MLTYYDIPNAPVFFTPPLSRDFTSDGPRLIELVHKYWRTADGKKLVLDKWQQATLNHLLETYPPGHRLEGLLRHRQAVISMARQNGKTLLNAVLSLYGLLQMQVGSTGPSVVGVAYRTKQANETYDRVRNAILMSPKFKRYLKTTRSRGISRLDKPGTYQMLAAKEDALQGIPVTLGLVDELHLLVAGIWDSIVNGMAAQINAIMVGITTAGSVDSLLLKRLYKAGYEGNSARFFFALWEAPEGSTLLDKDAVLAANPSMAEGRLDYERIVEEKKNNPPADIQRFTLNRFVDVVNPWISSKEWIRLGAAQIKPTDSGLVFSIDQFGWEYAAISVNRKDDDGTIHTKLITVFSKPSPEQLVRICERLRMKCRKATFVMDRRILGSVYGRLKDKGFDVNYLSANDMASAATLSFQMIKQNKLKHSHHWLTAAQMPKVRTKTTNDQTYLVRTADTFAVMSIVGGLYGASTQKPKSSQLFI